MKIKFVIPIVCIGLAGMTHAQQTDRSVLATAGNTDEASTVSIEWTMGEIAVQSSTTANTILTEGFHQPILQVEEIMEVTQDVFTEQIDISVFPNPTLGELHIKIRNDMAGKGVLSLWTINGILLQKDIVDLTWGDYQRSLIKYPAGLYILSFHTQKGELLKSFKIIKSD